MTTVAISDLVVGYGGPPVVDGVTCTVPSGSFFAVIGASGSGKTTLLRAIAGFVPTTTGTIRFDETVMTGPGVAVPPERRQVGIVTQDGSLFPHLSVARNIAFGLPRGGRGTRSDTDARVAELLELVGLPGWGDRAPHELSGGQQQRVALARALAPQPEVILLDEPFSALDAGLRADLGLEVRSLLEGTGTTTILVTHDQDEALSLADRVALMIDGRIAQQGSPRDVYAAPASLAVGEFFGDVTLLPVASVESGTATTVLGSVPIEGVVPDDPAGLCVLLRPEQMEITRDLSAGHAPGVVASVAYFGHDSLVDVRLEQGPVVRVRMLGAGDLRVGDDVRVSAREPGRLIPAR